MIDFIPPSVYPITDTRISTLTHLEQVRRLAAGGATLIQLREKASPAREFCADAMEAIRFARDRGIRIIINDRVDIALAVGADGVHLGQDDFPAGEARKLLGPEAIIGFSTHSLEQARAALELPVDYIAIGPVFPTETKQDPDPAIGIDGIRATRRVIRGFPLVAIGGISLSNARQVFAAGADSLAVISDLITDPELITERMQSFLTLRSAGSDRP